MHYYEGPSKHPSLKPTRRSKAKSQPTWYDDRVQPMTDIGVGSTCPIPPPDPSGGLTELFSAKGQKTPVMGDGSTRQKGPFEPPYLGCYDIPVSSEGPTPTTPTAAQAAWLERARLLERVAMLEAKVARLTEENDRLRSEAEIVACRLLRQIGFFDQDERRP